VFGVYAFLERGHGGDAPSTEIRLSMDDLAQMTMLFESKWRRLPTADEFKALVEDRIREDILYREALVLGLDQGDIIVKRRMAQKMKFLTEDMVAAQEPTTQELRTWFAKHSNLFAVPSRFSFQHLYFSIDRRGDQARDDAENALKKLADQQKNSELAASLADPFMFQDYYGDRTPQAIAREFGPEFALSLAKLTPESWQGPIKSGYGWHLVFVDNVDSGRIPAFEEIEQNVKTAWLGDRKAKAWQKAYEKLRAKYKVLLPVPADGASNEALKAFRSHDATIRDDRTRR